MAVTEGATTLFATLAVAVAATATVWLYGSEKWSFFFPQQKGAAASIGSSLLQWAIRRWSSINPHEAGVGGARCVATRLLGLIGNTPLIRTESLSNATGCEGATETQELGRQLSERLSRGTSQLISTALGLQSSKIFERRKRLWVELSLQ